MKVVTLTMDLIITKVTAKGKSFYSNTPLQQGSHNLFSGMTQHGIEPQSSEPLANPLLTMPMGQYNNEAHRPLQFLLYIYLPDPSAMSRM